MTFLHGSILALGSLLVTLPVVIHLAMRRRPKHALFPALRFVTATLVSNQRRLRLRQWALLALRSAAILAMAVGLSRPVLAPTSVASVWPLAVSGLLCLGLSGLSVAASIRHRRVGLTILLSGLALVSLVAFLFLASPAAVRGGGWLPRTQEAPAAAVFLVDSSPRMLYRHANQTRLEVAQEAARKLIRQFPPGSELAIMTTRDTSAAFSPDLQSASAAIQSLDISMVNHSIPDTLPSAMAVLQDRPQERKELYIFSDLTSVSWEGGPDSEPATADAPPGEPVALFVVDVGTAHPQNVRLGSPRLPDTALTPGSPCPISIAVDSEGLAEPREIELHLYLESPQVERPIIVNGKPELPPSTLRKSVRLSLQPGTTSNAAFNLTGMDEGVRHGRIQVVTSNGLHVDDTRFFSVDVRPPWRILLAAGPGAMSHWLAEALAPLSWRESGQARFECELVTTADLPDYQLADFAAVVLIDPDPIPDEVCQRLVRFVESGSGLAILLGRNAQPASAFHQGAARMLLPGRLVRQWKAGDRPVELAPRPSGHAILEAFQALATATPWNSLPVTRHWVFDDVDNNALTIIEFSNRLPALLETHLGKGVVLTMTTPLSDARNDPKRPAWNELPTGPDPWPFLVLVNEMMAYLTRSQGESLNCDVGTSPTLRMPTVADHVRAEIFSPLGVWQTAIVTDQSLSLGQLESLGMYRVFTAERGVPPTGVSANLPPEVTRLDRVDMRTLDDRLGADNYRLLTDLSSLVREVSELRVGREMFSWAALALALLIAAEHLLANRFYREPVRAR